MIFLWLDCKLFQDLDYILDLVKHLPTIQETQVGSLGWEDPLEKEMGTNSSTFAWKIPWTEEPGKLQSIGSQRVGHDWATSLYYLYSCNSAQCKMGSNAGHGRADWFQIEKEVFKAYIVPLLTCRVHHEKCWTGWSTSWNQVCRGKY